MQSSLLGSTSLLGMAFALRLWDSNILQDTVQHWLSLRDSTDPSYKQSPRMHQQGRKSLQSTRCNLETQLHWHSSQHCMRHMQQHPTVQVDCLLYHEDTVLQSQRSPTSCMAAPNLHTNSDIRVSQAQGRGGNQPAERSLTDVQQPPFLSPIWSPHMDRYFL